MINKEKFEEYEDIRQSGAFNMMNVGAVVYSSTLLDRVDVLDILDNYDKYNEQWPDVRQNGDEKMKNENMKVEAVEPLIKSMETTKDGVNAPKKLNIAERLAKTKELLAQGKAVKDIMVEMDVSSTYVHKIKKAQTQPELVVTGINE